MKYDTDKFLYKLGWIVFGVSILVVIVTRLWTIHNPFFLFPCIFYSLTNLYCPGCGGTRSVLSLLHGHPVASFRYNPIVIYGVTVYLWYMFSNTVELLSRHRIKIGMKYHDRYLWYGLAIILLYFVIRNVILVAFGIDITFS